MMALAQLTLQDRDSLAAAARLATAALLGLAVGVEREWSGHASGPGGRFAGLRTFLLLGILGGGAGLLLGWQLYAAAGALLIAGAGFVVTAYVMAVRRVDAELDGTTEAAALVVLALGALAGLGEPGLAAGAVAVVVFALGEKERLHWLVRQIGEIEMRAALQFAVMALVVLPALPEGPFIPYVELRPRALWGIVLLLSGINFAGYLARRAVGPTQGYGVTGFVGGLVSSTLVTLQFARRSGSEPQHGRALAVGVIAACTVLPFRVAVVSALLNAQVALALVPYLAPLALAGVVVVALVVRRRPDGVAAAEPSEAGGSPLRLRSAIQMAVFFQLAMSALTFMRLWLGDAGLTASAVVLGLTDVDALTVSMTQTAGSGDVVRLAAQGIVVGILSNTVVKGGIVLTLGRGVFRRLSATGLGAIVIVLAAGLWLFSGR